MKKELPLVLAAQQSDGGFLHISENSRVNSRVFFTRAISK